MRNALPRITAEFIGTLALTFIGGAAIINGQAGLVGVALAHGLVIAVMVSSVAHISGGHLNPAVTLGFVVSRRWTPVEGLAYLVAQLAGATVAAMLLRLFVPNAMDTSLGGQALAPGVSFAAGVAIETVLTFFLVFTVFATAVDPKGTIKTMAGFPIGMAVAFGILGGGPFTGGSLNPARSFGPAIVSGNWADHSVYWIGPLLGGFIAAVLYEWVLMERPRRA